MKLFVTVGTQLAFDRLIIAVDEWAGRNPGAEVFAQIGPTALRPEHVKWAPFIDAGDCRRKVEQASAVIAHAGMGSIITALELGKPIVVMPRRAVYNEHRNDHQIATARSLLAQGHVSVAFDEKELHETLNNIASLTNGQRLARHASPRLLSVIREFISSGVAKSDASKLQEDRAEATQLMADRLLIARSAGRKFSKSTKTIASVAQRFSQASGADSSLGADSVEEEFVDHADERAGAGYELYPEQELVPGIHSTLVSPPGVSVREARAAYLRASQRTRPNHYRSFTEWPSERLSHLRGLILLDGAVRRSAFSQSIGRSFMELPIDNSRSVLDLWQSELKKLATSLEMDRLPCRIVVGHSARPPRLRPDDVAADLSIERDPSPFRGTGGVLRDLANEYDDDDTLLVASSAQVLTRSLADMALDGAACGGDITILSSPASLPPSMMLVKCGALKQIPATGFIDFKEQGLRLLASNYKVVVHRDKIPSGMPIRTPGEYLEALRTRHQIESGRRSESGPFTERWRSAFAVTEKGATIAPGVCLHDSVVLAGASVESGSSIACSIVCGGTRIAMGTRVLGQILSRGGATPLDLKQ